jgi:hypothetical protein
MLVDDLPEVARLMDRLVHATTVGASEPPGGGEGKARVALLRRLLFENPWYESGVAPLVYAVGGRVVGFLGTHPRPLAFEGRQLLAVWSGPFVSDPEVNAPVGPLLLRTLLAGPQDATLTAGATPYARALWERLGGRVSHLRCLSWLRLLRPWRGAGEVALRERRPGWRRVGGPLWDALDMATARVAGFRPPEPEGVTTRDLDPAAFAAVRAGVKAPEPRVAYDAASAAWLLDELRLAGASGPVQRLVVDADDEPLGWYVAYLPPRGIGRVLGMGARPRAMESVLHRFLRDAWDIGAAAVTGRVEANLLEPLSASSRTLFSPGARVLVHSRHERLADALVGGEGDLTRLDGEWWLMSHLQRLEGWGGAPVAVLPDR